MKLNVLYIFIFLLTQFSLLAQPTFKLEKVNQVETSKNTVTSTVHKLGSKYFLYSGGDNEILDAFEIGSDGKLMPIESYKTTSTKKYPGLRGIVTDVVHGKHMLFAGLKGESGIEVYEIMDNGKLEKLSTILDTDDTYLERVITLQVIHMKDDSYLLAGGLETKPGMTSYKIHPDGSLEHIMSVADSDQLFIDGIIGMSLHRIDGKTYLFTGGFQDNGVGSWLINENGTFVNISNIGDDNNLFLNGAYPVISSTIKDWNFVVVGHRHHSYYEPTPWVKDRFSYYYHGDAISVFMVNSNGELVPRSAFIGNPETLIKGQTRLQRLPWNEDYDIIAAATRDDQSIQLCTLNNKGRLANAGKLDIGIPVYYGLTGSKIGDDLFLFAGSVDGKQLVSYKLVAQ